MAKLSVIITADSRPLIREVRKGDRAIKKFGESGKSEARGLSKALGGVTGAFGEIAKAGAAAAAVIAGVFVGASVKAIGLGREQIRVEKQLAAAIKSTGGAAGLSAEELKNLASELQDVTNFGDEATIAAQAMLLTFTNIGRETFPAAVKAIQNVATAMGTDLKSATLQVGKALNDPLLGLSALTESGIQFTEQQKAQVAALVATGQVMEAQRVILGELQKQFGGSAEAAADPLIQLGNLIGDIGEEWGKFLINFLNPVADAFKDLLSGVPGDMAKLVSLVSGGTSSAADSVSAFAERVKESGGFVANSLAAMSEAIVTLAVPLKLIAAPLALLATSFGVIADVTKLAAAGIALAGASLLEFYFETLGAITGGVKAALEIISELQLAASKLPGIGSPFLKDLSESFANAAKKFEEAEEDFAKSAESSGQLVGGVSAVFQDLTRDSFDVVGVFGKVNESLLGIAADADSAGDTLADLSVELQAVTGSSGALSESSNGVVSALNAQARAADLAAESFENLFAKQIAAATLATGFAPVIGSTFDAAGNRVNTINGVVVGGKQAGGVIHETGQINVERGEGVLTSDGMARLSSLLLNALNKPTVSFGDINVSGGGDSDFRSQARMLIPEIQLAVSRGVQAGLA